MNYSRAQLKQNAKQGLSGHWGTAIGGIILATFIPSLVMGLVSGIISGFSSALFDGEGLVFSGISAVISLGELAFTLFVVLPLVVGICGLFLNMMRNNEVTATTPFGAFNNGCFPRFTLTMLMTSVFTFLWGLLLIIPGIIKAYSYSMAPYLLLDHPDYDWHQALNGSKAMMNGHKAKLFILDLSFIGWFLLCAITLGLAGFYVQPYYEATKANFYRGLIAEEL